MKKSVTYPWMHEREDLFTLLHTNLEGLSADDVKTRLASFGKNEIKKRTGTHALRILIHQAINPLVGLLYAALFFSVVLDKTTEAIFIGTAILINIALGFFQEYKANNAINKLESYITHQSRVKRGGTVISIDTKNLVPGDILFVKHGDRVGADARLISSTGLEADESIITGESLAVSKYTHILPEQTVLAERNNMIWAGSVITAGEGEAIVVHTGEKTEIGTIASLVHDTTDTETPLEREVAKLAKIISLILVGLGILIFGIGLYAGIPLNEILLLSIAVIVSAVPGSIPVALSVVLAVGAETLAKKQGVVRHLSATETLGSTSLILTDKTGTLTEATLKLVHIDALSYTTTEDILIEAALNVDVVEDPHTKQISGRPVEIALTEFLRADETAYKASTQYHIVDTFPFSSTYKFSAIFFERNGQYFVSLLGAPDILLHKTNLPPEAQEKISRKIAAYAQTGERILGVVTKPVDRTYDKDTELEENTFSYTGLIRFRDPVRKSVPKAAHTIMDAGVRVIIVTGDHPGTAKAIAQEIGLWKQHSLLFTGKDLEHMPDSELEAKLPHASVFARMTPEQKLRLVELYTKQGEVVAVTGDGVNDAPALKRAAIGVAMGSGTDVARASADIVILDNNFETITQAIFEGRNVLRKMRSVITYLLADSYDELLLIGGSLVLAIPLPLTALQILFVKFFSDIFPAMGFTFEKTSTFNLNKKIPRTSLFDHKIKLFTLGRGLISSMFLFSVYIVLLNFDFQEKMVHTFIFASFASYMLFLAFSMRNLNAPLFSYKPFSNPWLTTGVVVGFLTIGAAIYVRPLGTMLGTVALPPLWLLGVIAIGLINLALMELLKRIVK